MTEPERNRIREYTESRMRDSAHDCKYVRRVMRMCERIAAHYPEADDDILFAACLHAIGRKAVDHAAFGAQRAREYLRSIGWSAPRAAHVVDCIRTHRFRGGNQSQSIAAKILFDSDNPDVPGAIARTLLYQDATATPIYEPREPEDKISAAQRAL